MSTRVMMRVTVPVVDSNESPPLVPKSTAAAVAPACAAISGVTAVPCGLAFYRRIHLLREVRKRWARYSDPNYNFDADHVGGDDGGASGSDDGGNADRSAQQGQQQRRRKAVKMSEEDFSVDWYDILKVPQAEGATDEQIRTAYRKRCLETHPDKQPDHSDELFKLVQKAFDILGDPDTRQTYDSSRPFDDSIPPEDVSEDKFYDLFGPVFERNKKWSSIPGLPSIGDDTTSLKAVKRFYDDWVRFQSWRDFSHEVDLEEIDEGMCREEKRFYMRENERQLNVLRRREQKRIQLLVERAMKNDPRLRREREAEEARRESERLEKELERKRIREEEERRRQQKEEMERQQKEEAQRKVLEAKNNARQAQRDLTEFLTKHGLLDKTPTNKLFPHCVRDMNVSWIFSKIKNSDESRAFVNRVISESPTPAEGEEGKDEPSIPAVLAFNTALEERERIVGMTRYGEAIKKSTPVAVAPKAVPPVPEASPPKPPAQAWAEEDLSNLRKAIAKFPGGSVDRWRKISQALHNKFTEEEVLAKTKELESSFTRKVGRPTAQEAAPSAPEPHEPGPAKTEAPVTEATSSVEEWTVKQQQQLEKSLRELIDYKERDKFQLVAKGVNGKTAKECFERFKYLRGLTKK